VQASVADFVHTTWTAFLLYPTAHCLGHVAAAYTAAAYTDVTLR
jgi:hypothetical protein